MAHYDYCLVCKEDTIHGGIDGKCMKCKSNRYKARKAEVKPGTMCARMVQLEEAVYDINKELRHGRLKGS